jgi:hypothetical protein
MYAIHMRTAVAAVVTGLQPPRFGLVQEPHNFTNLAMQRDLEMCALNW